MADEPSKSISFGFVKKKTTKQLQDTGRSVLGTDHGLKDEEEKDFLQSAEGNALKRYLLTSCERFTPAFVKRKFHFEFIFIM